MSTVALEPDADLGLVELIHGRLIAAGTPLGETTTDEWNAVAELVRAEAPLLDAPALRATVRVVLDHAHGLGPLEPWLADAEVTDVMVNGGGEVWVDRAGALVRTHLVLSEEVVLHLIERVVAPLGLSVDRAHPVVDARLGDGSRVHAIIRPLAVDGPCLTIRRFGAKPIALGQVAGPGVEALLTWAVRARANVVVAGGAGAGKTTLLNALAGGIDPSERVVTVEDAAELRLPGAHVVRLEARPANAEGVGEVRIRDLVRAALRMRPDRIIVGEVRGGEALDMLQAMNTGHEGSLSTCHANSPGDALRRLETLVLLARGRAPPCRRARADRLGHRPGGADRTGRARGPPGHRRGRGRSPRRWRPAAHSLVGGRRTAGGASRPARPSGQCRAPGRGLVGPVSPWAAGVVAAGLAVAVGPTRASSRIARRRLRALSPGARGTPALPGFRPVTGRVGRSGRRRWPSGRAALLTLVGHFRWGAHGSETEHAELLEAVARSLRAGASLPTGLEQAVQPGIG